MRRTFSSVLLVALTACPGGTPGRRAAGHPSPTRTTPTLELVAAVSLGARPQYEINAGPFALDAERKELYVAVQCSTDLCSGVRGRVRVVSTASLKVLRSIPLALNEFLTALEVDPPTGDVYAVSTAGRISKLVRGGSRFSVVRGSLGDATGIAIDAARRRIIVAGNTKARVWAFDMDSFRPLWTARLSDSPSSVVVNPASGKAYASHTDAARISSIDLTGGVNAIRLPGHPAGIALDEEGKRLLVTQDYIDTTTDPNFPDSKPAQMLSSIELETGKVTTKSLSDPWPGVVAVDRSWIYVATGKDTYAILVLDRATGGFVRAFRTSSYVESLASSAGRLYVLTGNGKLLILGVS